LPSAPSIGLAVAAYPPLWVTLFSHEAEVLRDGAIYLRIVAPAYGLLGFGFVLAFAAQGAGHVLWPFVASFARILIAAGLGWLAVTRFGAAMAGLAGMVAISLVAYAAICSLVMLSNGVWRAPTV
jgi:Na+-driven multidrug efflux pump